MPRVFITTRSGEEICLDAVANRSLMENIRDSNISELLALCAGCCSCATCHVYIDPATAGNVPAMTSDEDGLLDGSTHRRPTSRLSCQIRITNDLDGLKATIAPED